MFQHPVLIRNKIVLKLCTPNQEFISQSNQESWSSVFLLQMIQKQMLYSKKIAARKKREQEELSISVMDLSSSGEALPEFSQRNSCFMVIPVDLKSNIFACEENDDFVFPSCKSCQRRQTNPWTYLSPPSTLIPGNTHASLSPSKAVVLNISNAVTIWHSSSCIDPDRNTIFAALS